jgi:hypothetical protein
LYTTSLLILSQNFAPAFIMLRVALGQAHPDTEQSGTISGLQFASNPRDGMQAFATRRLRSQGTGAGSGTNTILTVLRSSSEHEVDVHPDNRVLDLGNLSPQSQSIDTHG